ncbi:MAG: acetoin utilization protein AcuC [Gammaproteobacteria bacterium]|nr:acetoin utilization protein AcuC [Gammaproteobacteria bacterium]
MTVNRREAVLIGAAHYRRKSYGKNHPLAIPRVSLAFDVIRAYGALSDDEFRVSRVATPRELERFHTRDYIQALRRSEAFGHVRHEDRLRHALGTLENPYFPGVFHTPALATGGSIQGAEEVLAGRHAFSPAGGMHHAMPDQARGFCYFNDVVLAILTLRDAGRRVLYLDLDAHHGDGVEAAFWDDPAVLTVSVHMDTAYAYPFHGGTLQDQGGPLAPGSSLNVPLPKGTGDADYLAVLRHILPVACARFAPDVIVLQAGTDALHGDPLGRFRLSTAGFLAAVADVIGVGLPILVTGGGGYHPLLLARAWTGVWALLSGRELPATLPEAAAQALRAVGWDVDEDEPYYDNLFLSRLDYPDSDRASDWLPAFLRRLDDHTVLRPKPWVS